MIISRLKPCCYQCEYPDVQVDTYEIDFIPTMISTECTIYCSHDKVCKAYIESEEE